MNINDKDPIFYSRSLPIKHGTKRKSDNQENKEPKRAKLENNISSAQERKQFSKLASEKRAKQVHGQLGEQQEHKHAAAELISSIESTFPGQKLSKPQKSSFEALAQAVIQFAEKRLKSKNCLTQGEILSISNLLFKSSLKDIYTKQGESSDPLAPSIPVIFRHLSECIENMQPHLTCERAVREVEHYLEKKPVDSYENLDLAAEMKARNYEIKPSIQKIIDESRERVKNWEEGLKFPIMLTRDKLKSNNFQDTYVLNSKTGSPLWIFKPDYQDFVLNEKNGKTASFEHTDSLVSEIGQFRVPKTIYIQLLNWSGSAQFFIDQAKKLNEVDRTAVPQIEIQKIILFDLLFANSDRHANNILFNDKQEPFAIDHDLCFLRELRSELRLEYMECVQQSSAFSPGLLLLLSNENLEKYEAALKIHEEVGEHAISWMRLAAAQLKTAIEKQMPIVQAIEEVKRLWAAHISVLKPREDEM